MKSRYLIIFIGIITLFQIARIIFQSKNVNDLAQSAISSPLPQQTTPGDVKNASAAAKPTFEIATKSSNCLSVNGLPDKECTPGAIDPNVNQDNIQQTICVSGYTKTVRPEASYTNELKLQQIRQYNYTDTNLHDYEEDHLISLELGGAASNPANLWPELGASPNPKDKIENLCHQKVCNGQISLKDAQSQIATDWHSACQ